MLAIVDNLNTLISVDNLLMDTICILVFTVRHLNLHIFICSGYLGLSTIEMF